MTMDNHLMQIKCNALGDNPLMKLISIDDLDLLGVIFDPQTGMIPVFENTQRAVKHGLSSGRFFEDDEITNHMEIKYESLLEKETYDFNTLEIVPNMTIFENVPDIQEDLTDSCHDELLLDFDYSTLRNEGFSEVEKDADTSMEQDSCDKTLPFYFNDQKLDDDSSDDMIVLLNEPLESSQDPSPPPDDANCYKTATTNAIKIKKPESKPKKEMKGNPCSGGCPNKCTKLNEHDRRSLFDYYWSLNYQKQRDFLLKYINVHEIRRRRIKSATRKSLTRDYFLPKDGVKLKVCRRFFMSTLDVTDKLLRYTETSNDNFKNSTS